MGFLFNIMVCERCNKEHSGSFGTGRFCSQRCANSRGLNKIVLECSYCKKSFSSYKNNQTYCSRDCYLKEPTTNKHSGGYRPGSGRAKTGYYKGIYCGSSYELVWVIYQLDHKIKFKRFDGILEGNGIRYIPDFLIGNVIFEMKGYESEDSVSAKTELAKSYGYDVVVLRKADLKNEFEWVKKNYSYKYIWELYDDYKPKFTYNCDNCLTEFGREKKVKTKNKYCSRKCAGKGVASYKPKRI
jgi:hypothetical protein